MESPSKVEQLAVLGIIVFGQKTPHLELKVIANERQFWVRISVPQLGKNVVYPKKARNYVVLDLPVDGLKTPLLDPQVAVWLTI